MQDSQGEWPILDSLRFCRAHEDALQNDPKYRDLPSGTDPFDLEKTGWGLIISPEEENRGVLDQLDPLLKLRENQAKGLYLRKTFEPMAARDFLWRDLNEPMRPGPGTIRPTEGSLPYYLLLVGSPEQIPFHFQYDLAINHAVGRVFFQSLEDYRIYAEAVLAAETAKPQKRKNIGLFSVPCQDKATEILQNRLIEPLVQELLVQAPDWQLQSEVDLKSNLKKLLNAPEGPPNVLLAACHGKKIDFGDPRQENLQGALACFDTALDGSLEKTIFSGQDLLALDSAARPLQGMIVCLFACYSAGTPFANTYRKTIFDHATCKDIIAESPFIAALPKTLLAKGALAVLSHVDRGLTASVEWLHSDQRRPGALSLIDSVVRLLEGHRIGHALRPLFRRYSYIAAHLLSLWEARANKCRIVDTEEAGYLEAFLDSRGYIVLGDPAVVAVGTEQPSLAGQGARTEAGFASAIILNPQLARQARAIAASRGQDLTAWVNELVKEGIRLAQGQHSSGAKANFDVAKILQPFAVHVSEAGSLPEKALERLKQQRLLHLVGKRTAARLTVERRADQAWVVLSQDGRKLGAAQTSAEAVVDHLVVLAQRFKIAEMMSRAVGPKIALEFVVPDSPFPRPPRIPWTEGGLTFKAGQLVALEACNNDDRPLWLYLLDLGITGSKTWLFAKTSQKAAVAPGKTLFFPKLQLGFPSTLAPEERAFGGLETFVLLASSEPVEVDKYFSNNPPDPIGGEKTGAGRVLSCLFHACAPPELDDLKSPSWSLVSRSFLLQEK